MRDSFYCKCFGGDCTLNRCKLYEACLMEGNILPINPIELEELVKTQELEV
jgi:hypothetical protein